MREDADAEKAGMRVEARMYLVIAGFLAVAFFIYLLASYEWAGTVLLLVGAVMGVFMGGYLERQARLRTDPAAGGTLVAGEEGEGGEYLPHASIWPFGLGVGALLMANGLALGLWAVLPGAALMAGSVWGFARQSKLRS
jgi:Cytochrome c oxidase subunit IV